MTTNTEGRMATITHGVAPFETKGADLSARTFEGLASTWDLDLGGDIIHKGAYSRTLSHWRQSKRLIPLGDAHPKPTDSIRRVLGKLADAEETDAGLVAQFKVVESPDGDEFLARVKGGFITGLSIGYEAVPSQTERKGGVRHLKEVKLWEVSAVIWPMNEGALINPTSVKALTDALRDGTLTDEQEAALRGLSVEHKARLRALLDAPPADTPDDPAASAPEPKGLAPEAQEALRQHLLRLKLRSLVRAA